MTGGHQEHIRKTPKAGPALAAALAIGAFSAVAVVTASPAEAVIGGEDATETYPFMTALYNDSGAHYCGGALVFTDTVAHADWINATIAEASGAAA